MITEDDDYWIMYDLYVNNENCKKCQGRWDRLLFVVEEYGK